MLLLDMHTRGMYELKDRSMVCKNWKRINVERWISISLPPQTALRTLSVLDLLDLPKSILFLPEPLLKIFIYLSIIQPLHLLASNMAFHAPTTSSTHRADKRQEAARFPPLRAFCDSNHAGCPQLSALGDACNP